MNTTRTLLATASRLFKENQHAKSIVITTRLLDMDGRSAIGWALRGMSRHALQEHETASTDLQRALELDPTSHRAREVYARCLYALGQPENALTALTLAIKQQSTGDRLMLQAQWRREIHWPCGALSADRTRLSFVQGSEPRCRLAHTALREGDPALALEIMQEGETPLDPEALLLTAQIAYDLRDYAHARKRAQQILAMPLEEPLLCAAAKLLFQTGPFQSAAEAFATLADRSDASVHALAWHARCLLFAGDDEAETLVQRLWVKHNDAAQTHLLAGIHAVGCGEEEAAQAHFTRALSIEPTAAEAHLWLGELHRETRQWANALAATDAGIYHHSEYNVAGELNRILTIHSGKGGKMPWQTLPPSVFVSHLSRARDLIEHDVVDQAIQTGKKTHVLQACRRVLQALHGNRTPWPTRKEDGAPGATRIHIAQDPRQESRRLQLLLQTRSPEEVIASFDPLQARYPTHSSLLCHRGEVFLWMGQFDAARADFEAALALDQTTRWAWIGLGASQILSGDPHEGIATFKHSEQFACPGRTMWVYLAEAHWHLGQHSQAHKNIQKALELNPERTSAHILCGLFYAQEGRNEEALQRWSHVHARHPALCRQIALMEQIPLSAAKTPEPDQLRILCTGTLKAMRGNRASGVITWFFKENLHICMNAPDNPGAQYGL